MCTVSMVGDFYSDKWKPTINKDWWPAVTPNTFPNYVGRHEFEALKKEVQDMKELLKRAVKYDENNNEPNCEMEDKIAVLKKMAEIFGISLDDVFKGK